MTRFNFQEVYKKCFKHWLIEQMFFAEMVIKKYKSCHTSESTQVIDFKTIQRLPKQHNSTLHTKYFLINFIDYYLNVKEEWYMFDFNFIKSANRCLLSKALFL